MRFALLGEQQAGLAFSQALVDTGEFELAYVWGKGLAFPQVRRERDLETILADPEIELVIIASPLADRPTHLRRALQAERHVCCVAPAGLNADLAHEAALLQGDTKRLLLPIYPWLMEENLARFRTLLVQPESRVGTPTLLELQAPLAASLLLARPEKPSFLHWDLLRGLVGEIAEVSLAASSETLAKNEPVLCSGRASSGLLFQVSLLPGLLHYRVTAHGTLGQASWQQAEPGAVGEVTLRPPGAQPETSSWRNTDPWQSLAHQVAQSLRTPPGTPPPSAYSWHDMIQHLELDEAARRSMKYQRTITLDYQEMNEEVGFKSTMTLIGCGLLWLSVGVLCLACWKPILFWLFVPILGLFLSAQLLRWLIPPTEKDPRSATPPAASQPMRE